MKVIKHGNTVKELTCPCCGCIFTAVNEDTRAVCHEDRWYEPSTLELRSRCYVERFVCCPECGYECGEEDISQ